MTICLESDAYTTSIAHLKARCLLSLAPGLASASTSSLVLSHPLVENAFSSWPPAESSGLALVMLLSKVHLESLQDEALEDYAQEASLATANVLTGSSLRLEWGRPSSAGKKLVRFSVSAGESSPGIHVAPDKKEIPESLMIFFVFLVWVLIFSLLGVGTRVVLLLQVIDYCSRFDF